MLSEQWVGGPVLVAVLTIGLGIVDLSVAVNSPAPLQATVSDRQYGPDGPWQAVSVGVGEPSQKIDLYPGASTTDIFTIEACRAVTSTCGSGGLFDSGVSMSLISTDERNDAYQGRSAFLSVGGTLYETSKTSYCLDGLNFSGKRSSNSSIALSQSASIVRPDNLTYPAQVGKLGLGSTDGYQNFSLDGGTAKGNFLANNLAAQNVIPSASYGLHIGSSAFNIPLSLWLGGYDASRIVGPVLSQPYNNGQGAILTLDLLDISISVGSGASPFSFGQSRSGLLQANNASIPGAVPVMMDAAAPYMYLPNSTCAAIASNLPVTYDSQLGLYLWDTASPSYARIITSPSYLEFQFQTSATKLTIKVPFALLNLTLEAPLKSIPTPYFPCQPPQAPNEALYPSSYSLGRAFLQAAFIGVNWGRGREGTWWLANAPGPSSANGANTRRDVGAESVKTIQNDTTILETSNVQWEDTWSTVLKPLASSNNARPTGSSSPSGLRAGPLAGIVVGCIAFVAIMALAGLLMWKRQQKNRKTEIKGETYTNGDRFDGLQASTNEQIPSHPSEISSGERKVTELDTLRDPIELSGSVYPTQIGDG